MLFVTESIFYFIRRKWKFIDGIFWCFLASLMKRIVLFLALNWPKKLAFMKLLVLNTCDVTAVSLCYFTGAGAFALILVLLHASAFVLRLLAHLPPFYSFVNFFVDTKICCNWEFRGCLFFSQFWFLSTFFIVPLLAFFRSIVDFYVNNICLFTKFSNILAFLSKMNFRWLAINSVILWIFGKENYGHFDL